MVIEPFGTWVRPQDTPGVLFTQPNHGRLGIFQPDRKRKLVLWSEPVSRFTRYGYFYLEIHSFRAALRLRHTYLEHWVIGYQQRLLSGVFRNHGSPHFFPKKVSATLASRRNTALWNSIAGQRFGLNPLQFNLKSEC